MFLSSFRLSLEKPQKNTGSFAPRLFPPSALIQDACHRPNKKVSGLVVKLAGEMKNHKKLGNDSTIKSLKSDEKTTIAVSLEAKNDGKNGFLIKSNVQNYFFSVPLLTTSFWTETDASNSCHLPQLCKHMGVLTSDTSAQNHRRFDFYRF